MGRSKFPLIVYAIIGLALIGIVSQLLNNPVAFLKSIFVFVGVSAILVSIVYFIFLRNRAPGHTNEMRKYKQAVKQSQLKYKINDHKQVTPKNAHRMRKKNNQRPSHLRVIEGNRDKPKRKNRATF